MLKSTLIRELKYYYKELSNGSTRDAVEKSINETKRMEESGKVLSSDVEYFIAGLCWKYVKTLQSEKGKKKEIEDKFKILKKVADRYGYKWEREYFGTKGFKIEYKEEELEDVEKVVGVKILKAFNRDLADEIEEHKNDYQVNNDLWKQLDHL